MTKQTKTALAAITWLGMVAAGASAGEPGTSQGNGMPDQNPDAGPAPATSPGGGDASKGSTCEGSCQNSCNNHYGERHWYSPGSGFRPVETAPVYRDAIAYYRYWPDRWYGQPGWNLRPQFPMVYMPTDTTQLGVYYQRVPQWLPNPSMYPPAPRPADWHRRVVYTDNRPAHTGGAALNCGGFGQITFDVSPEAGPNPASGMNPEANPSMTPQLGTPGMLPNPGANPQPAAPPSPIDAPQPPSASMQNGMVQWPAATAPGQWVPTGGWPSGYAR